MSHRYPLLALCCWLAVGASPFALPAGSFATGLRGGWLIAGAVGVCTFALVAWAMQRPLAAALGATTVGFLSRLALLSVGLVATARLGGSPAGYCTGFFAVYLPLQAIEIAALLRCQPPAREARA